MSSSYHPCASCGLNMLLFTEPHVFVGGGVFCFCAHNIEFEVKVSSCFSVSRCFSGFFYMRLCSCGSNRSRPNLRPQLDREMVCWSTASLKWHSDSPTVNQHLSLLAPNQWAVVFFWKGVHSKQQHELIAAFIPRWSRSHDCTAFWVTSRTLHVCYLKAIFQSKSIHFLLLIDDCFFNMTHCLIALKC